MTIQLHHTSPIKSGSRAIQTDERQQPLRLEYVLGTDERNNRLAREEALKSCKHACSLSNKPLWMRTIADCGKQLCLAGAASDLIHAIRHRPKQLSHARFGWAASIYTLYSIEHLCDCVLTHCQEAHGYHELSGISCVLDLTLCSVNVGFAANALIASEVIHDSNHRVEILAFYGTACLSATVSRILDHQDVKGRSPAHMFSTGMTLCKWYVSFPLVWLLTEHLNNPTDQHKNGTMICLGGVILCDTLAGVANICVFKQGKNQHPITDWAYTDHAYREPMRRTRTGRAIWGDLCVAMIRTCSQAFILSAVYYTLDDMQDLSATRQPSVECAWGAAALGACSTLLESFWRV